MQEFIVWISIEDREDGPSGEGIFPFCFQISVENDEKLSEICDMVSNSLIHGDLRKNVFPFPVLPDEPSLIRTAKKIIDLDNKNNQTESIKFLGYLPGGIPNKLYRQGNSEKIKQFLDKSQPQRFREITPEDLTISIIDNKLVATLKTQELAIKGSG